jgi:hypothetical protein
VERKWKNYHITTFPGHYLSKTGLVWKRLWTCRKTDKSKKKKKKKKVACSRYDVPSEII